LLRTNPSKAQKLSVPWRNTEGVLFSKKTKNEKNYSAIQEKAGKSTS
jgi:hypothetical protein